MTVGELPEPPRLPKPAGAVRAFWARHPRLVDSLVAVICWVWVLDSGGNGLQIPQPIDGPWWTVNTIVAATMLFRRSRPWWTVLAVTAGGTAAPPDGSRFPRPGLRRTSGPGRHPDDQGEWRHADPAHRPLPGPEPGEGRAPRAVRSDCRHSPGRVHRPEHAMHMRGGAELIGRSKRSRDPELARRLWTASEDMTGIKFEL
ncbi:hypothetical protein [Actinoplanes sp. NBRC 103695]|uniref:hypothetical protein n=1 Tax=Actinoplanes sp. NBRC 103695 TaxID=3032202 RepID=UPI002556EF12|nr:hypothetical protein [Actinoplanes sp. NBRC 103695]